MNSNNHPMVDCGFWIGNCAYLRERTACRLGVVDLGLRTSISFLLLAVFIEATTIERISTASAFRPAQENAFKLMSFYELNPN
jgi:hypothetical protein